MLLAVAGLVAIGAAPAATTAGQAFYEILAARLDVLVSWVTGWFTQPRPEAFAHLSGWSHA